VHRLSVPEFGGDRARRSPRPLLWQFPPFKKFNETDFASFLELLPRIFRESRLRHVVEVRQRSLLRSGFIHLLRNSRRVGVQRARNLPGYRGCDSRLPVSAPSEGEDTICNRLSGGAKSQIGPRACVLGSAVARQPISRASKPRPRKSSRVTYSSTSSTTGRCARPPPRWR